MMPVHLEPGYQLIVTLLQDSTAANQLRMQTYPIHWSAVPWLSLGEGW